MSYEDELKFLDTLGRGRRGRLRPRGAALFQTEPLQGPRARVHLVASMLRTATGKTQAIFKITNYGKGRRKVANHLSYISRNAKLALENQAGEQIIGGEGQRELLNAWQSEFGTNKRSRDTVHMVLSTPPGSSREAARAAASEFLAHEFGKQGHDYVFVAHEDTAHPHVHAVVKMQSLYGHKLNPRKTDLHRYREQFAKACRAHGIEVEASPRCERGLSGVSQKSKLVQMKRDKRQPKVDKALIEKVKRERESQRPVHPSSLKTLKRNQIIRKRYAQAANALLQQSKTATHLSDKTKFERASWVLDRYAKTLPLEINRGDKLHQQIDQKLNSITPQSQAQLDTLKTLYQYLAVTQGQPNNQGIYVSALQTSLQALNAESLHLGFADNSHDLDYALDD